jgi:hypothetical protein
MKLLNKTRTIYTKHIFLDIIGYSFNRSVETQENIISELNRIVKKALNSFNVKNKSRILLPTGDGLCICLIDANLDFDIHILLALKILEFLFIYNNSVEESASFKVRIGINQNLDNLVIDVNGKKNIAGSGINMAQRIMDKSEDGIILVGEQVFQELRSRQRYLDAFRKYQTTIKHGETINLYQLFLSDIEYLNVEIPETFKPKQQPQKVLKKISDIPNWLLVYFSILIQQQELIKSSIDDYFDPGYFRIAVFYISKYLTDFFGEKEFESNYRYHLEGSINYEKKQISLNSAVELCKKQLETYFHLDLSYYVDERIVSGKDNIHFFEEDTKLLKVKTQFIDEIKEKDFYHRVEEFEFID